MKKIFSLLLALMMLSILPASAFADSENTGLAFSNISIQHSTGERDTVLDLDGLKLAITPVQERIDQTYVVNISGNNELLLNAFLRLDGDDVYVAIDGMSNIYRIDIASFFQSDAEALSFEQLVVALEQLLSDIDLDNSEAPAAINVEQNIAGLDIRFEFDPANSRSLFEYTQGDKQFSFSSTIQVLGLEVQQSLVEDVSEALNVNELTEDQLNTLKSELTEVLSKPIAFVMPALLTAGIIE